MLIRTLIGRPPRLLVLLTCLVLGATCAQAAPPPSSTGHAGIADGPPVLTGVRLNNGAASTWDASAELTWTATGPSATHLAYAFSPAMAAVPWLPIPASGRVRVPLPQGADQAVTLHVRLMNDRGVSTVRTAALQVRQRPLIQSATIDAAHLAELMAQIQVNYSGSFDRWALTRSALPPTDAASWTARASPWSGGIAVIQAQLETPDGSGSMPHGSAQTAYLHLQREDSPIHSRALPYVYNATPVLVKLDLPGPIAPFLDKLLTRGRLLARPLAGGANCQSSSGMYNGTPGQNSFTARPPNGGTAATEVRCQFQFFAGLALAPGWTLERMDFHPGGRCRVHAVRLGTQPDVVVETTVPAGYGGSGTCAVSRIELKGPLGSGSPVSAIP